MLGDLQLGGAWEECVCVRGGEGCLVCLNRLRKDPVRVWVSLARWGWRMHLPAIVRPCNPTAPQECPLLVCLSWTLLSPLPLISCWGGPP